MPMDPSIISRLLQQNRGTDDPSMPPQNQAPVASDPGLSQAYDQPVPPVNSSPGVPPTSQFMPNQGLEQQAQAQGNTPMHPIIAALVTRMGLLNMLRNRANSQMIDPNVVGNY